MFNWLPIHLSSAMGLTMLCDIQIFEQNAEVIFSILTKVFILALVSVAIIYIVKVLADKSYFIRNIHVPASFETVGHSGSVIANRIYYRIQQIIQRVSANYHLKGYSTAAAEKEVSVDVGGMGLPIKGFVELLGGALGIKRGKKIDADIFIEQNCMVMLLKISGHPAERLEAPVTDSIDIPLKSLISEAAETVLKFSNDEILQTYFGIIEQIGEKQIRLAKYRFENCRSNANTEVNIIAAWAWGLCMLKRYEEAEKKIMEGIALHQKAGRIYVIWGSLLTQQGKFEEGVEKFKKGLEQVTKNESITRISNIYSSIGNCYVKLGQYEAAKKYLEQAIEADPNASRPYFNLGIMHLAMNNHQQFFEVLESALEKGFQTKNVAKDPKCAAMVQDPRMVMLIKKYSNE